MRLEIELRFTLFPMIILEMSTTWLESICCKFNWLDMIWKGTIHTHIYIRSQIWQCMSEQKPSHEVEEIVVRTAPRQDCDKEQIWGRVPTHFCSFESSQEQWPPSLKSNCICYMHRTGVDLTVKCLQPMARLLKLCTQRGMTRERDGEEEIV